MIKIEGGAHMCPLVKALTDNGVPVCAHLGLAPQSVHLLGGYKVQGRDIKSARQLLADARELVAAGAQMVLVECVPAKIGKSLTRQLDVPVIGIGAGSACDGQVLVMHDLLGLTAGKAPRFVKNFMQNAATPQVAFAEYVHAVKTQAFPAPEHQF